MKTCTKCGGDKGLDQFYKNKKDKPLSWCKQCMRDNERRRREENGNPPYYPERQRAAQVKYLYGITLDRYESIIAMQGGTCATCDREPISVDHDHSCCPGRRSCGQCVRGILCKGCNLALGHVNDDPGRLLSLVKYLQK